MRGRSLSFRAAALIGLACAVGVGAGAQGSVASPLPVFSGAVSTDFATIQAAPGAIADVYDPAGSGESVLRLRVRNGDVAPLTPTANPRAQLLSPPLIEPGDEFWLATKFFLPRDLPRVSGWMSLVSVYGAPFDGPSPWQIKVEGDELVWQRNGSYGWDIPWRMPLAKGRWVSLLLHERFARDGWVEMWIDGRPAHFFGRGSYNPSRHSPTRRLRMATVDASNGRGPNAAKIMQYREAGMFRSGTVYFGPLQVEKVGG